MKKDLEKRGDSCFAEGALSILSVIRHASRPVHGIYVLPSAKKDEKNILRLLSLARKKKIPIIPSTEEFFASVTTGHTHGGVIAQVGEREMKTPEEVLAEANGFAFLICGIEDPFNFGCAVRSFYAAGAGGMLLTPRNWLSAAGVTIRSSAGTSEALPCACYDSPEELCQLAHRMGYRIVCASETDSVDLYSAELKKPLLMIVGGEKRGISASLMNLADTVVKIPYARHFPASLSAASATTIIAYEIARQNF